MKTARTILKKYSQREGGLCIADIIEAMEEYASQLTPSTKEEKTNGNEIEVIIPDGFYNVAVSVDNYLVADTNNSTKWDTMKFPLPNGVWNIKNVSGKVVTLISVMKEKTGGEVSCDLYARIPEIMDNKKSSSLPEPDKLGELIDWLEIKFQEYKPGASRKAYYNALSKAKELQNK